MKKESGHIFLFVLMITLLVSGGLLTYSQVQNDMDSQLLSQHAAEINTGVEQSALDTLRFLVDPSYEYCEFECTKDESSTCERLSKTVVSVSQRGLKKELSGGSEISRLPANSSINLLFETYSVSRRSDSCSTNYYLTVESFDTYLENIQKGVDSDISAFNTLRSKEIYEAMQSGESFEMLKKFYRDQHPS